MIDGAPEHYGEMEVYAHPSSNRQDTELLSTFHEKLLSVLRNSQFLKPLHVEVQNESYWYYMRQRLNPRRHSHLSVKYNPSNLKHEAYIYDLKRREEDLEIVPKKTLVGTASSKWQAFQLGEQAMRERDKSKPIIPDEHLLDPTFRNVSKKDLIANTHFRITIVSEVFKRIPSSDRLILVYDEILSSLGISVDPNGVNPFITPPSQFKLSSTYGNMVCNLPIFRFLLPADHRGTYLQFCTMSPSQWRPDQFIPILSERLGKSHGHVQQLQIDSNVKPLKQKQRIKKLTTAPDKTTNAQRPTTISKSDSQKRSMADTLGLDPTVSGVAYEQLGGIYGHFFNDLSNDVRDMVLNKYKDNKDLIRTVNKQPSSMEQKHNKTAHLSTLKHHDEEEEHSFQPRTHLAKLRSKLNVDGKRGDADTGTMNQEEMREEVLMSNKRVEMAAVRIQRIRRTHLLIRAIKQQWKKIYSTLTIQRIIRGQFGRRYAKMFSRLKPIAAIKIQKFYRDLKRYCVLKMWNYLSYRITRVVLPKIKLFIKNCFVSWIRKRNESATLIQKICRGRIARVKQYKIFGQRVFFKELYQHGAIQMQKIIRAYLARKYYREVHVPQKLFFIIVIPAVIRMQRIFRGRIAKKVAARKRYELKCLLLLQRVVKSFVRRVWDEQKRIAQLEKNSATTMQRLYRGFYDRKLYKLKYYFYWYDHIYIPTIIKLQSCIRCFHARRVVNMKRTTMKATKIIQRAYRFYRRYLLGKEIRRKLLEARRNQNIILIQKNIRRFLYRKKYQRMLLSYRGRTLYAAKIILRAWRSYKLNQKYQILLENHRKEVQDTLLKKYLLMRKDIKRDIKELRNDIAVTEKSKDRYKSRLKELESYLSQAEFRLNKIKTEMNGLSYEDFERGTEFVQVFVTVTNQCNNFVGWAEALGQEYEFIIHQQLLAKEEIRLVRNRIMILEREILQLFLELEETEMEFDDVDSFSNEMVEKSRIVHLQRAERKASYYLNRLIYRERVHWKVESNRVNKMRNLRHNYQAIMKEVYLISTCTLLFYIILFVESRKLIAHLGSTPRLVMNNASSVLIMKN